MVTELFYSRIFNMNSGPLHSRSFRRIHFSVFRYRWTNNGFTGPKSFRGFRETGPRLFDAGSFDDLSYVCKLIVVNIASFNIPLQFHEVNLGIPHISVPLYDQTNKKIPHDIHNECYTVHSYYGNIVCPGHGRSLELMLQRYATWITEKNKNDKP